MVKADPKCDYYADLELTPSAELAEIKKQFKKLALKYHPDRNPGKELEFNSKFQAIQCAHEILTDPQQRAKYDSDRVRNGLLHTYGSSVRPQPPPRTPASNFPPPPRRTPQATAGGSWPHAPSPEPSRYTSHARPAPGTAPKSYAEQSKERANAFKAWEQMRHGQGVPPQARPVPPRPTKPAAFQPGQEAGSYPPQDSAQRHTWDQSKEPTSGFPKMPRSNTTRVPRKGGFAPGFTAGNDPPVKNTSAYFNTSRGERPDISRTTFESRPAPPPPPSNQGTTPKRSDPFKAFRPPSSAEDPSASTDRISTPYATSGGEKTYFTSTGLGRSATSREGPTSGDIYDSEPMERASSHTGQTSSTAQRGHHSASPKFRSPRPVSISSISTSSSDESLREGVEQLYTSAERSHDANGRSVNGHLRPTYKPFVNVDTANEGKGHPNRTRTDPVVDNRGSAPRPHTTGSEIDPGLTEGFKEHRTKHEAERAQGFKSPVYSPTRSNESGRSQQRPLHRPKSWHEKYGQAGQDQTRNNNGRPANGDIPAQSSIFSFPNNANGQRVHPPPLRSHSSDTISVNFSPSDWHGKFTGKPEEYFEPRPRQTDAGRGRVSPTKRTTSPLKKAHLASSAEATQVPNGDPHVPPPPPESSHQESYSPDKWAPYFRPGTLNWPPPPPPPTAGAARVGSRKRPKTPSRRESRNVFKRPAVPKPAGIAPAAEDGGDEASSSTLESMSSSRSSGNGSAMDLDASDTPTFAEKPAGSGLHRASDVTVTAASATPRKPVPPRASMPPPPPPQQPASEEAHLNLGNLKNVAPFAPNQEGIKDLNDLTTALPFESKPSIRVTSPGTTTTPQPLALPNPPKAPVAPEKLTQPSWERYVTAMRAYMHQWNAYNAKMLSHFNERQAGVVETTTTALKPEWMSSVGEGGYERYMRGVEEDFRVRAHWDVSWERHRECMRTLGGVREKLLGGSIK